MPPFRHKITLITGGGAGIGRALCRQLAHRGATVIAADLNEEAAQQTARVIQAAGGRARAVRLDVTDAEAVQACVDQAVNQHGRLDLLFNNAGITILGELRDQTLDNWRRVVEVNLMGVVHGVMAAYPHMVRQGSGHIVNVASLAGLVPFPSSVPYTASKHAVVGLSTALRAEAADFGVRVSVVCPAFIRTGMMDTAKLAGIRREAVKARQRDRFLVDADRAAQHILRGVARNREFIVLPAYARLLWWVARLIPAGPFSWRLKVIRDFRKAK